jgi:hydrogenase maturation protease
LSDARTAILGVGNVLMGDDGVGVRVVERLQGLPLPDGIEAVDAGTASSDVLPGLAGCALLVVVDAVRAGGAPGEVYAFDLDPDAGRSPTPGLSLHDANLAAALQMQRVAGVRVPPIRVLGVEPADVSLKLELSDAVRARVPELADRALREALAARRACAPTGGGK